MTVVAQTHNTIADPALTTAMSESPSGTRRPVPYAWARMSASPEPAAQFDEDTIMRGFVGATVCTGAGSLD